MIVSFMLMEHILLFSCVCNFKSQRNTFQCVMASDGQRSYIYFLYADGLIQWTTGDASGGMEGLGGTPAQVGFDAGDGVRFATIPESQTAAIINISSTSNVGITGMWIFRVEEQKILISEYGGTLLLEPDQEH